MTPRFNLKVCRVTSLLWTKNKIKERGRPSVVNLSFDFHKSDQVLYHTIESTVNDIIALGAHVVVPAGNEARRIDSLLASMSSVITVGASTLDDKRASFSNYGPELDVFAPGKDVWSACNSTDKVCSFIGSRFFGVDNYGRQ